MLKIEPFEKYTAKYDKWFEKNHYVWESELNGFRIQLSRQEKGIEIGVGSARFAIPLGIKFGIEPSRKMGKIAKKRGINVIAGIAEELPLQSSVFDCALMVTAICFFNDLIAAFHEAFRILKSDGMLIIGFIDKKSRLGKSYEKYKKNNVFYREATFYSVAEVVNSLKKAGFVEFSFSQTIFNNLSDIKNIEPVKKGHGDGSFVIIKAKMEAKKGSVFVNEIVHNNM